MARVLSGQISVRALEPRLGRGEGGQTGAGRDVDCLFINDPALAGTLRLRLLLSLSVGLLPDQLFPSLAPALASLSSRCDLCLCSVSMDLSFSPFVPRLVWQ